MRPNQPTFSGTRPATGASLIAPPHDTGGCCFSNLMTTQDRNRLRDKQDRVLAILKRRNLPMDIPISSEMVGCPCGSELHLIHADFEPCLNAFLAEFDDH